MAFTTTRVMTWDRPTSFAGDPTDEFRALFAAADVQNRCIVFEPGHSLFIIGTPFIPGTKKGLWVGQTCLMTEQGLERLCAYPVDQLRIVPT